PRPLLAHPVFTFSFYHTVVPRHLHSFPTRRSSDLHQLRYGLPGPALHRAALLRALGQGYLRSPILRLPLGSGSPTGAFLRRPRGTSRAMWSSRVIRLPTSAIEEDSRGLASRPVVFAISSEVERERSCSPQHLFSVRPGAASDRPTRLGPEGPDTLRRRERR